MKVKSLVKYVGLASLALGANGAFASLTFDADGAGGDGAVKVDAFDWAPTSFLALGGTTAIENFVTSGGRCPDRSCEMQVYTHALLIATTLTDGTVTTPAGLNNDYEITMVLSFTEVVTGVVEDAGGLAIAVFAVVPEQGATLQIFYDETQNANNLTGQGFNDGRLIANSTTISDSTGLFSVSLTAASEDLDQAGSNDYPGIFTVVGTGSQGAITMGGFTLDPTFFLTDISDFTFRYANISQALPFISADPSGCFTGDAYAGGIGTNATDTNCDGTWSNDFSHSGGLFGGLVPKIGFVNGVGPNVGGGPDFIAQTDFNSPVTGSIPVPSPLALMGLGLLGLGLVRRRKR